MTANTGPEKHCRHECNGEVCARYRLQGSPGFPCDANNGEHTTVGEPCKHDTRQRKGREGELEIVEVDAECNITYSDSSIKPCEHRPHYTFAECAPGYGDHGFCPKWNYYNREKIPIHFVADIGRDEHGNAIILGAIEEGCSKEDFIRLVQIADKEGSVNVTVQERP